MLEKDFQQKIIKTIKELLPGAMVLKMDPTYKQGIPDVLILCGSKWAALEVKRSLNAHHQPNQDYWVKQMKKMAYAAFICPENMKEVLDEVCRALKA